MNNNNVLELNPDNFDNTLNNHTMLLVEFYAPWCGYCKRLEQPFNDAAKHFKNNNSNVVLAKVDVDKYRELGSKYDVKGYPTIYWFKDGNKELYNGPRDKDGIVKWVDAKINNSKIQTGGYNNINKYLNKVYNKYKNKKLNKNEKKDLFNLNTIIVNNVHPNNYNKTHNNLFNLMNKQLLI